MGLLTGELTEQDEQLHQSSYSQARKYKPSVLKDIGSSAIYGAEKGLFNLVNAATRPIVGDEEADKALANIDKQIKPTNQGTAGHVTSGITEMIAPAIVTSPLGGTGVIASAVGLSARASEHSRLTQTLGVGQEDADVISNMTGATMAALTLIPMSNVFSNSLKDYALTVGGTTAAGQAVSYVQGDILESKGYEKQGQMFKDMATDPAMIATNLAVGSAFWALGRLQNDSTATAQQIKEAEIKTNEVIDQAIVDADRSSIPNIAETADDLIQHQINLNQAIEQVMKGEKVNISEATGGKLKTLEDIKNHIKNNNNNSSIEKANKSFTATGTKKKIYDEALSNGLSDSDARTIVALAHFESGGSFSPTVKNPKSSATGVFQFIDSTWKAEGGTSSNRHDLNTQIKLGIKHTKSNIKYIENKTGVVLTGSQIYVPHLLGRGGAEAVFRAIKENPEQSARSVIAKFDKDPDQLMKINGIPRNATISNAISFFTKKIDDITRQHYGGTGATHTSLDFVTESSLATKPESSFEGTVDRLDLDNLPIIDDVFISTHDVQAFQAKSKFEEVQDLDDLDLPDFGLEQVSEIVTTPRTLDDGIDKFLEELNKVIEQTPIPYTAKGVRVKDDSLNTTQELKPDPSIHTQWKESQRWEDNKYQKELTRSYTDKDGNLVQELQYRGTYVRRVVDDANQTKNIHVARSNRSDFKDHKGNQELETALDRIFDEGRAFGYLSQIPKGQQTIDKLIANPDLVISSKKTGEDLTAQQWQQKLQKEQDNIQLLARSMVTLAKCALSRAS